MIEADSLACNEDLYDGELLDLASDASDARGVRLSLSLEDGCRPISPIILDYLDTQQRLHERQLTDDSLQQLFDNEREHGLRLSPAILCTSLMRQTRPELVKQLITQSEDFGLPDGTCALAILLFDRILLHRIATGCEFPCGLSIMAKLCLMIASKFQDHHPEQNEMCSYKCPLSVDRVVRSMWRGPLSEELDTPDKERGLEIMKRNKRILTRHELWVLSIVKWNLCIPTIYSFLQSYIQFLPAAHQAAVNACALPLVKMILPETTLLEYPPSVLAMAVIVTGLEMIKMTTFRPLLIHLTRSGAVDVHTLLRCVDELAVILDDTNSESDDELVQIHTTPHSGLSVRVPDHDGSGSSCQSPIPPASISPTTVLHAADAFIPIRHG